MKRKKCVRNILLNMYVVILFSCTMEKASYTQNSKLYSVDFDTLEMKHDFSYSNLFDSVAIIKLDSQVVIGNIGKMDTYNDKLVVLDDKLANCIFVFDKKGNLIRKIGSLGFGPEEYNACTDFAIDRQTGTLYIYDWNSKKIHLYDIDTGNHLNAIKLDKDIEIHRIWCNGGMLYGVNTFFSSHNSEDNNYILRQLDLKSGCEIGKWMDIEQYNKGWRDMFNYSSLFYHIKDGKDLFAYGLSDTVMCIKNGKITPYMAFCGNKVIKKNDILADEKNGALDSKKRAEMHLRIGNRLDKITGILDLFEHDDNLYFSYTTWPLYMGICNMKTGNFTIFSNFKDDILYTPKLVSRTLPFYLTSDDGGVYYCLKTDYLQELKYHFSEGFISYKIKDRNILNNINEDSNPLLLYYEYIKK